MKPQTFKPSDNAMQDQFADPATQCAAYCQHGDVELYKILYPWASVLCSILTTRTDSTFLPPHALYQDREK